MNENYAQPPMPAAPHTAPHILKGMYAFDATGAGDGAPRVQLMGAGTIFNEVIAAAAMLRDEWGVPGLTLLARDGQATEREHLLHPESPRRLPHVTQLLQETVGR